MSDSQTNERRDPHDPSVLAAVIDELGGSDRVLIYRQAPGGGFEGIGTIEGADITGGPVELFELLRHRFGGGKYQLRVQEENENGRHVFKKKGSAVVRIAGDPEPVGEKPKAPPPSEDRLSRLERLVERALERPEPSGFNMDAMLQFGAQLAQTQMPLIQALTERQGADAKAMLEVFRDGMDLARSEGSNGDPYGRIGELLTLAVTQRGAPPVSPQALPAPREETPPNVELDDFPEHVQQLAPELPKLVQAARARVPAATVAENIAGAVPAELVAALIADPVLVDDLCAVHPPLGRYRTWAGDLIAELAGLAEDAAELQADEDETKGAA